MFTPVTLRRISRIVLLTFTSLTLQESAMAAGQGAASQKEATGGKTAAAKKPAQIGKKAAAKPAKAGVKKGKQAAPVAARIAAPKPAAPSQAARYGQRLQNLQDLTGQVLAKQGKGQDAGAELKQLRQRQHELEAMEVEVDGEFAATGQHIRDHKLPAVIEARERAAEKEFHARQAELKQRLKAFADADDAAENEKGADKESASRRDTAKAARTQKLNDLDGYLKASQKREARSAADPDKLPFGAPVIAPASAAAGQAAPAGPASGKPRAPRRSLREYRASLAPGDGFNVAPEPVMLAGPIPNGFVLPATSLPATPVAADLAATEDVPLTPAIKALAQSLGNNPVQINNWVRNNIEYVPSYGSIQGADATLQTRRGNDIDTASLLIALLRAAGTPARYVYGTIQVPGARVANWMGVANPDAALQLLAQGGVPSQAVTSGGTTAAVVLEHVWVEAWVDYTPSRGAINKNPDTWVQLDASFKQYTETPGLSLANAVSLNAQGVLDGARKGAACTADYAQSLNGANIAAAYGGYKTQLSNFLAQQGASLTVGNVLGARAILPENPPILMGTLPYATVVEGGKFNLLPDALRWKLSYALYASAADRAAGLSALSYTASLPALAGHRLTVSYSPATAADAATLASYLPAAHANGTPILASEFPATLPAYLINVRAELRLDGQAVAAGGTFALASQQAVTTGLFVPASGLWDNRDHDIAAGEYQAIVLDGQGMGSAQIGALKAAVSGVSAQLAANQTAALARDDVTGLLLQQAGMGYFALADANTAIYARASGTAAFRMPSQARAVARVEPQYAFGVAVAAAFPGIRLNIDRYAQTGVAKQAAGPVVVPAAYNRQGLERASAYAADALQNLFADALHPGSGDSAVRALAAANVANQPIRLVNAANASAVAATLTIDPAAVADIQNATAAGKQSLVQNGVLASGGWSGSGYVIEDTATGTGDYRLTGPASSIFYPAGGAGWPVQNGMPWPAGMAWLALASPAQSGASVSYAFANAVTYDNIAAVVLAGMDGTRWQYFPAQEDILNGLFLSGLNAVQPANACDAAASLIASGMAAGSGINNGNAATAVNHPPVIQSNPVAFGAAGQAYSYAFLATDPDGDKIAYSIVQGPSGMAINAASGLITWAAPLQGSYNVTLRADDGKAYADQSYVLTIGQGALPLGLTLVVAPAVNNTGDKVTVSVVTTGGQGAVTRSLTVDGAAIALDAAGNAVITAGAMGAHPVIATASDAVTTLTRQDVYSVRNPANTTPPAVAITAPLQDAAVTAPVDITGSASSANLAYYRLLLKPAGAPATAWVELSKGFAPVTNAKLGSLDPTVLANGLYDLGLVAVDVNGAQSSAQIGIEITRDLKLGQFSLSYTDLDVTASGIPIRVTRTYDTRNKGANLDFGYGWSVDYQSVQLRKNMTFGLDWNVSTLASQFQICLRPGRRHKISITLPDGSMQRFSASISPDCATAQVPAINVVFTPEPGTTSTLAPAVIPPNLIAQGGQLYDMDALATWDPADFVLTTEDKYVYNISAGVGITSIVDPYGNTLTYGANGITHSNGTGVAFTRDAANRITRITDPLGKSINYAYDAAGNLASVSNRNNEKSAYAYNSTHGLVSYTDPSGVQLVRYTYDAQGRMIAATDATGKSIQTNHDTLNNQDIVTDRLGRTTTYAYDANGDVTKVIDPTGAVTTYGYDALGNEASVTDPLGNVTRRTFDPATGKQLTESDPLGNTTSSTYDSINRTQLNSSTDANGNVTSYSYFTYAQNITGPLNSYTHIGYDAKGNLNGLTAAGQGTSYAYDLKGNKTSETDAAGNTTSYTYDANGRELTRTTTRTDATGTKVSATVSRMYDAEGRVVQEADALGGVTRTQYNSAGKPVSVTDPAGNVTRYTYDSQARLIATTYPDNTSETVTFDAEGNQVATTDRAGRTTQYTYDGKNRLTKTVHPDGTADTITYNAAGLTVATHDANGNPVSNAYDAAGRLTSSTDALGGITRYAYDKNGNRVSQTDPKNQVTSYTYDALNRLVKTAYPDASTRIVTYLANGRKAAETDQNGNTVSYGYDALGRINQVTLTTSAQGATPATTAVTTYAYDEQGNKVAQTDALGRTTKWAYDNGNRVTSRTLPNGETESYTYDLLGNRLSRTDFTGKKTSYTVDVNGRVLFATDANNQTTGYTYTASGQIATVTDKRGITRYGYDASDRITIQYNPDGSYLTYAYDANGNVIQRSTPNGTVAYAYDTLNRLAAVTNTDGKVTNYTYDANGNRIKTVLSNGTEADYTFDALNRLTTVEHRTTATQAVIRGYAYTLKPNGQRAAIREYDATGTLKTRAYSYDSLNRLTGDVLTDSRTPANSKTTAYAYGNTGNRTSKTETQGATTTTTTYTYDADDRLASETRTQGTTTSTTTYAWDANGNLTQKTEPTQTTIYTWDGNNRLSTVQRGATAATATTIASYQYDAQGNRIGKTTPTGATTYLVDSNQPYAQVAMETATTAGATPTTSTTAYLYGLERIQLTRAGQGTYYHDDGLGSTRVLTDATGTVTDSYEFDDYGALQGQTGTTKNDFLYAGEQYDSDAGLYYNRARYLDVNTGRFTGLDPYAGNLSQPITLNKYAYAGNDPINGADPSGRMTLTNGQLAATGLLIITASIAISPGWRGRNNGGFNWPTFGTLALGSLIILASKGILTNTDGKRRNREANYVYRGLDEGEDPSLGLTAKDPLATYSPEYHVRYGGFKNVRTQWISTTKSQAIAQTKYDSGNGVVRIDLGLVHSFVLDVSSGVFPGENKYQPISGNFARSDEEVLILGYVPADAIEKIR